MKGRDKGGGALPDGDALDGRRDCARGDWCSSDEAVTRWEDGQRIVTPERGYRPFCDSDRAAIRDALASFPRRWTDLTRELGERASATAQRRASRESAPMEYRADVDALMRLMVDSCVSWHDRVAAVPGAGLEPFPGAPDPEKQAEMRFRRGFYILAGCADALAPRLDVLVGLPPAPMSRTLSATAWAEVLARIPRACEHYPSASRLRTLGSGDAEIVTWLDGTRAGLEILHLDYRCQSTLGEIPPKAEPLDGVRCYKCQQVNTLVRAELPSDPAATVYWSRCKRRSCGHQLTERQYQQHVARLYAAEGGRIITPVLEFAVPGAE